MVRISERSQNQIDAHISQTRRIACDGPARKVSHFPLGVEYLGVVLNFLVSKYLVNQGHKDIWAEIKW
jgi:hypothetical protein